jgi:tetratricopeptide (TPR) repeat protein
MPSGPRRKLTSCWKSARQLNPQRAEDDLRYIFAKAALERHRPSRMNLYRRATEMEPRFEVVKWQLAFESEQLWRSRRTLERNVAGLTLKEYEKTLEVNPGNVSAWANRGYIRWLLGSEDDLHKAEEEFESGLEYKLIKPQTFVFQLDYGLARIAAERGEFTEAYEHYLAAVSSLLAKGESRGELFRSNQRRDVATFHLLRAQAERCDRPVKRSGVQRPGILLTRR